MSVLALLLTLQASVLARPMHLAPEPPPLASIERIALGYEGATGKADRPGRSRDETLALAQDLARRLRAGHDFQEAAAQYSWLPDASRNVLMGTFVPGVLPPEFDAFAFEARDDDVSEPLVTPSGIVILRRVASHAGVRRILLADGEPAATIALQRDLLARLRRGEDFGALAQEFSADKESAARGGAYAIYERGVSDTLLKREVFRAAIGDTLTFDLPPFGHNIVQRVPVASLPAELREQSFVRLRAILVQSDDAQGADPITSPGGQKAKAIAEGLYMRLVAGESFAKLAGEHTDDPGGRAREGELGWIHRGTPGLLDPLAKTFLMRVGDVGEPQPTSLGWVIVKRER